MTWCSHMTEIARQGIWASLTGGWYYEPSNSMLCNTVHLYLWLVFFVVPLLLGMLAVNYFSSLVIIYIVFVFLLFFLVKSAVMYLHRVFDKTEPTIITKPKEPHKLQSEKKKSEVRRNRLYEMIEMNRLNSSIEMNSEDQEITQATVNEEREQRRSSAPVGMVHAASAPTVNNEVSVNADVHTLTIPTFMKRRERSEENEVTTDAIVHSSIPRIRPQSYGQTLERKLSEPILSSLGREMEEEGGGDLLVTHSLCANLDKGSTPTMMEKLRPEREETGMESIVEVHAVEEEKEEEEKEEKKENEGIEDEITKEESEIEVVKEEEKDETYNAILAAMHYGKEEEKGEDEPCCSKSLNDRPSTSAARSIDLKEELSKGDLTRFLEELVQRHPDALDIMERVRRRRITREEREEEERRKRENTNDDSDVIMPIDPEPTIHVADNYDDTSQGAMHSFQDEKGTWWSYTFDETGVGTARPLGKSHQIKAMLGEKEEEGKEKKEEGRESKRKEWMDERAVDTHGVPMGYRLTSMHHSESEIMRRFDRSFRNRQNVAGALMREEEAERERRALQAIPEGGSSDEEDMDLSLLRETNRMEYDEQIARRYPLVPLYDSEGNMTLGHRFILNRIIAQRAHRNRARGAMVDEVELLPRLPSNVLYVPPSEQRRSRRPVTLTRQSYVPSRLVAAIRATEEIRLRNVVEAHERREGRRRRREMEYPGRMQQAQQSRGESIGGGMGEEEEIVERGVGLGMATRVSGGGGEGGGRGYFPRKMSTTKKKYYYDLELIPFIKNRFRIKMDRLALCALFDRNRSILSVLFDLLIALAICCASVAVLSTHIYHDVSLVAFAFVTASAHFSLMKSVQPDAASPTHGFNWQVSYSRPFYFLILSSLLLYTHHSIPDIENVDPWNWNLYRISSTSWPSIILSIRDIISMLLLLMPIICTVGWLPQVSTLFHHILEQIEMIILGGTASFGPLNALAQLSRTLLSVSFLVGVSLLAHWVDHSTLHAIPMAFIVQIAFLHSRMSSNPHVWSGLMKSLVIGRRERRGRGRESIPLRDERGEANEEGEEEKNGGRRRGVERGDEECVGSLPSAIMNAAIQRVRRDLLFSCLLFIVTFALHCTTVLTAAQPWVTIATMGCTFFIGILNHYIYLHLRKYTPWKLLARPILRPREYGMFEADQPAALMHFEKIHMWMLLIEKNVLYPVTVISCLTASSPSLFPLSPILLPIIGFRLLRSAMAVPHQIYIPLGLSFMFSYVDFRAYSPLSLPKECTWLDVLPYVWYLLAVGYPKWQELTLKLHFVMAYMAPWQITWGSAFHAFAQPFAVPHTMLISAQTAISSILSAPLNPFLGSSFITASYVRPIKFWEKDYNTERSDASNTRLASQFERGPMLDDSNLNAVFYEHLTRSLQTVLAGDIVMGRWGTTVEPGDCFILASFYLNCLVHIVEVGNGYVTFQLRGLEFRGTYCHQREVEAISEDVSDGLGCCCCSPGSLPGLLSLNTAWGLRWTAWEVVTHKYIVDGYSITDNSAISLLQVHELRRLLVTLYSKCIIYFTLSSPNLTQWIHNEAISSMIDGIEAVPRYVDVDHIFCTSNDEDYDSDQGGVSRQSFLRLFSPWIDYCMKRLLKGEKNEEMGLSTSRVQTLLYSLSLLGRRALGQASFNRHSSAAESFLYGLHSLFKGDFRITCARDEWIFAEIELLQNVIAQSVRMGLKLHQDHFTVSDDLDDPRSLFYLIKRHEEQLFISHEHDPAWRGAIMANVPSLLALRHMYDDGQDDYKIIMLNKMNLNMRVIKLNRECVRAFWSGQQQELVFLRNRNPERGSIQNARQVLRNMINSSADQPVGYPIYVSPLTTSFIDTHPQYESIVGQPLTIQRVRSSVQSVFGRLRDHFGLNGSNSLSVTNAALAHRLKGEGANPSREMPAAGGEESPVQMEQSVVQLTGDGARVKIMKTAVVPPPPPPPHAPLPPPSTPPPSTSTLPPPPLSEGGEKEKKEEKERREGWEVGAEAVSAVSDAMSVVQIVDDSQILRSLHEPMKSTGETLVVWPREVWRTGCQKARLQERSLVGVTGMIVYTWYPNHANRALRSHCGEVIHLVMVLSGGYCVPVKEKGIMRMPENPEHSKPPPKKSSEPSLSNVQRKKEEESGHRRTQSTVSSKKESEAGPSTNSL